MYKDFHSLYDLFAWIKTDKEWNGANASLHNRYPIRFILFENFADFNEFIINRPDGIYKHSIDTMLNPEFPDLFLSYTQLSKEICDYVKKIPINDFIIYPFSEMTRFYENVKVKEFDALVKTIRLQQPPEDAQLEHVRLYIPIVGMQEKMGKFITDNNTFVWEYKTAKIEDPYTLILTNGTFYGVNALSDKYSVVENLREWLKLWEQGEKVKQNIICSSKTIYSGASNAQPDNAFEYVVCDNAFDFLKKGLRLNFGDIQPQNDHMHYWEELASYIDISNFNFSSFINARFNTFNLNSGADFIKTWFDCESDFDRWLLTMYYQMIADDSSYICRALKGCIQLSRSELFSNIATLIFDEPFNQNDILERKIALNEAERKGVGITEIAENKLRNKLIACAEDPNMGYDQAVRLLTSFTKTERKLAIEWLGEGYILRSDIEHIYRDLFNYTAPYPLQYSAPNKWINSYFDNYRDSKLGNKISANSEAMIMSLNENATSFQLWRDNFKTVRTLLYNRKDIEVFYWIDGLGVEWVPYICKIIKEYEHEGAYLNEVLIASAELPTTTSVNKEKLETLVPNGILSKCGDLDKSAHEHSNFPDYMISEMSVIKNAITSVLDQFNGKKIAFISDHGISYLAQYGKGLNLSGIIGNHEGRVATQTSGTPVGDNKYYVLEDKKTLCALSYDSLSSKVNKGHGAHGGCTPEEVLVPIIIVSSNKNASSFTAKIMDNEINGTNPVVQFSIVGLSSVDIPLIEYNGLSYAMNNVYDDVFESERLSLNDTATLVTLRINDFEQKEKIKISTGVKEEDLFDEF